MSAKIQEIKSQKCEEQALVRFRNLSPRTVTLYWHNYVGKLVKYATIKPEGIYKIETYVSHPWSVSDTITGDKLFIDKSFIYYPQVADETDEEETDRRTYTDITLPVYPLWIRCLQILRKTVPRNKVDRLQIPNNLKHALKYRPDLRCSTYSHFQMC